MRMMSILAITILVFVAANAPAQPKIVRKELYKANIGAQPISTVDVREIVLQPKQKGGLHRHPCPVVSYVVEGTIRFQIRGEKMQIIHPDRYVMSLPAQSLSISITYRIMRPRNL